MDGGAPTMQRGGGFHGKSAYFSVDIFVDHLEAAKLPCRVPSIAFQFLDFPAITVYSPAAGEIRPHDGKRHSFNQGKSCVFEMVEYDLHERMRREPLRLAWVDAWQLKDKELASTTLTMVAGMDRKVHGRPAHVQQGKFRLHDPAGQPVCVVQLRVSVVTHGNALQPELLKQRDYRTAPKSQHGLRDDWQPVIKRLVREYHEMMRQSDGHGPTNVRGGAVPGGHNADIEQIMRKSESVLTERLDGISRRMAQVQRTNLELSSVVAKLEERGSRGQPSVKDQVRIAQLEEDNRKLQEQMVEMARLQVTSARGLQPTQVLQAIKFQIAELLKLNPNFDLQAVFDAFDVDGDGIVSTEEFVIGLRELGIALEPTQIPAVLELLPTDSHNQIGYKTFVSLFGGKEQHVLTDITNQVRQILGDRGLQLKQAFRAMDTNHDGVISRDEFAQGLQALQIDLHPEKLKEFLRLVDADADGMINYYDFLQHFGTVQEGWDWAVSASVHDQQLRTSLEWAVLRGKNDPVVISPDGWDRTDLQRSLLEPITLSTYLRRVNKSETRKPSHQPGSAKWNAEDSPGQERSTMFPSDNAEWMRESLDPALRDGDRPYEHTDSDTGRKTNGTEYDIHRDGFDCPPALMFVNSGSTEKHQPKHQPMSAGATPRRSPARKGRSAKPPKRVVSNQPSAGRSRYSSSSRGGPRSTSKQHKQSRGASRELVLDAVVDQVSYANATAHAASLLSAHTSGQIPAYGDADTTGIGMEMQRHNRAGKKPKRNSKPKEAWASSHSVPASEDASADGRSENESFSPPKRGPQRSPAHTSSRSPRSARWATSRAPVQDEVVTFLGKACPAGKAREPYTTMYIEAMQELGVVEMADLELLDETDLRSVGVPMIDARRLLRAVKLSLVGDMGGVPSAECSSATASVLASFDGCGRSSAERQLAETMAKATAALAARDLSAAAEDRKPALYERSKSNRQPKPEQEAQEIPDSQPEPEPMSEPFRETEHNTGTGVGHPRATTPSPTAAASGAAPTAQPSAAVPSGTTDAVPAQTTASNTDELVRTQTAPPRAATATAARAAAPTSGSPAPGPAQQAQHQAEERGDESAVARYAREQREAKAKQEAEAIAAKEAEALAQQQKRDAEEKVAAEAKAREQAALKAKLEAQRKEIEAKEKAARDAAAAQAREEQLAKEAAAARAQASSVDEEIPDEVDDYDDDSFSESVVDSPPPAVSNTKAPAAVSARSPVVTKKPPAGAQQKSNTEVDDVMEEISMESIEDDIEVDIDVSG
jgi:Ca2+-binding EF-hand superfamily protein